MNFSSFFSKIPYINYFFIDDSFTYVALGDSTVEGIGASHISKTYTAVINSALQKSYKKVTYHNFGKRGVHVADVVQTQLQKTIESQPDLITISIGANDIFKRKSIKQFTAHLDLLLRTLTDQTDATIVINTIPDFSHVPSIPPVLRTYCKVQGGRFNKIIEQTAHNHSIIVADLYTHTKVLGKNYPEIFAEDGLHPSDLGYAIWAQSILTKIEDILQKKTGVEINTETIIPTKR
ncbi:MAG TPA: SGNH/GDSL hydrolase family protein [Candidatus Levybacteria bacterium]|nr:SGNH/GDSL hydrolase family protein [Candidatus Levybacteria bacterium]